MPWPTVQIFRSQQAVPPRVNAALEIFSDMVELKIDPDVHTYAGLINGCAKARPSRIDDAITILHDMRLVGLPPSLVVFNTVLNAFASQKCAWRRNAHPLSTQCIPVVVAAACRRVPSFKTLDVRLRPGCSWTTFAPQITTTKPQCFGL